MPRGHATLSVLTNAQRRRRRAGHREVRHTRPNWRSYECRSNLFRRVSRRGTTPTHAVRSVSGVLGKNSWNGTSRTTAENMMTNGAVRGVQFLFDERGEKTAVLIDLKRNRALWEDILDAALARERAGEPRESLERVKQRLRRAGKLPRDR